MRTIQLGDIVRIKKPLHKTGTHFDYLGDLIVNELPLNRKGMVDAARKDGHENAYLNSYLLELHELILVRRSYNEISSE